MEKQRRAKSKIRRHFNIHNDTERIIPSRPIYALIKEIMGEFDPLIKLSRMAMKAFHEVA